MFDVNNSSKTRGLEIILLTNEGFVKFGEAAYPTGQQSSIHRRKNHSEESGQLGIVKAKYYRSIEQS